MIKKHATSEIDKGARIDGKWNIWRRLSAEHDWVIVDVMDLETEADEYIENSRGYRGRLGGASDWDANQAQLRLK